jgi:hypothetical protein
MVAGFIIGLGITFVGAGFVATSEYIEGITLILLGCCWIDDDRINSEIRDLKDEVARLRKKAGVATEKQPYTVIG